MLREVSINDQNDNTSVEELSVKYKICDCSELFTVGVLSNPLDTIDYYKSEACIDTNDDKRD